LISALSFFLSFDTDCFSESSGSLGSLSSDLETPFMSATLVTSDFEHSFDVLSEFGFEDIGGDLQVLSFLVILVSVEEPLGDTVSFRIGDDASNSVALLLTQNTGSDSGIDSQDFTDKEAKPSSHSLNLFKGEWDSPLSVDVGVEDTMDVLERVLSVVYDQ
jgi:hypothetical protein